MTGASEVVFHASAKDGRDVLGLVPERSPDLTRRTVQAFLTPQTVKLPALAMLGRISATHHVTLCDPKAKDGSEVPVGLLYAAHENPARGGYLEACGMYVSGSFDPAEVTFAQGWKLEAAAAALARVGIVLRKPPVVANCWTV